MVELKECPHCGGIAKIMTRYSLRSECYYTFIKCKTCGAQSKSFRSLDDQEEYSSAAINAAANWNLRA